MWKGPKGCQGLIEAISFQLEIGKIEDLSKHHIAYIGLECLESDAWWNRALIQVGGKLELLDSGKGRGRAPFVLPFGRA